MKIENKKTWTVIFLLIALEQGIKLIINYNFLDKKFPLLPPLLYFEPVFNRDYSWLNSMLQFGGSKWIHIAMVAVISILLYLYFHYLNEQFGVSRITNMLFAFVFSGAICSLIDKAFWDGSLDYIRLDGLFTFDLKDAFLSAFTGLLLLSLILRNKDIQRIDDKNVLKGFLRHVRHKGKQEL